MNRLSHWLAPVQAWWQALSVRERSSVLWAGMLLGLALIWLVALAPALRVVRTAPAQHRQLDAQQERMLELGAQAQSLQALPRLGYEEALQALRSSVTQHLGAAAQVNATGERVSVSFNGVPAEAFALWLVQARDNARASMTEWRLSKTSTGWDGTVVLSLPGPR